MKQHFEHLVPGLAALSLTGIAARNHGGDSNQLVPSATTIDVNDIVLSEGDSGSTAFDFTVRLSEPHDEVVSVQVSTFDGTAESGDGDYDPMSGTLTFDPGTIEQVVSVVVNGDN